jgi:hypothetical protein
MTQEAKAASPQEMPEAQRKEVMALFSQRFRPVALGVYRNCWPGRIYEAAAPDGQEAKPPATRRACEAAEAVKERAGKADGITPAFFCVAPTSARPGSSRKNSLSVCELRHITLPRIDLRLPSVSSLDWDPSPMTGPFLRSAVGGPRWPAVRTGVDQPAAFPAGHAARLLPSLLPDWIGSKGEGQRQPR